MRWIAVGVEQSATMLWRWREMKEEEGGWAGEGSRKGLVEDPKLQVSISRD